MCVSQVQPSGASEPEPTSEDLFNVVSNRRRRFVVHALQHAEGPMELRELADQVAEWESDSNERVPTSARKSVYTSLQQVHLPKMDDAAIVAFDKDRGVIEPTPNLEDLDVYIEFVEGEQIPWHQYYLGLTAVNAALLVAVAVGAWPFYHVPVSAWMGVTVTTFAISGLAHAYYMRERRIGTNDLPPELRR